MTRQTASWLICLCFGLALTAFTGNVKAEDPDAFDCFAPLSVRTGLPTPAFDAAPRNPPRNAVWKPSENDRTRGFAVGRVDGSLDLRPDWVWDRPNPSRRIDLFVARGEYRSASLAIRSLQELKGLTVMASDLTGPDGRAISASHTGVFAVHWQVERRGDTSRWWGRFLEKPFPIDVPAQWTTWLWVMIQAPKDAAPGVYSGRLTIRDAAGHEDRISVRLRVLDMDFNYAPQARGLYLPGHFADTEANFARKTGDYKNYATPDFQSDRMVRYFKYWKTRGLNSPFLFHNYPVLDCVDGRAQASFAELSIFARAMGEAGLAGPLCLDTRHISWWANKAGRVLAAREKEGKSTAGDLGVAGWQGDSGVKDCPPQSKELFAQVIRELMKSAGADGWPKLLLAPEEEVANSEKKSAGYDTFMPVLRKTAGDDHVIVVDNAIGYGRKDVIDRGARDEIPIREYNNWTEAGLSAARTQGAQVWAYNGGFRRGFWGLYAFRIGATGLHQWADHWNNAGNPYRWTVSLLTSEGVVTSVDMERAHEGICDFSYFEQLQSLQRQCRERGLNEAAQAAQEVLDRVNGDLPVGRPEFWSAMNAGQIDWSALDTRRWQAVVAMDAARRALGQAGILTGEIIPQGKPGLMGLRPRVSEAQAAADVSTKMLHAPRAVEPVTLDAHANEPVWHTPGNNTGSLVWTASVEMALRARAAAASEAIAVPSAASARVAYGNDGLYLFATANHSTVKTAIAKHKTGDPALWEDDCLEFFFVPGGDDPSVYQLIVNVPGQWVMLKDGRPAGNGAVNVATRSPINPSGGYAQEIRIPWTLFGLDHAPIPGSAWRFNVGREFHKWKQLTSWSQVYSSFHEKDAMGVLVFANAVGGASFTHLDLGSRFPGLNGMSGQVRLKSGASAESAHVELLDQDGRVVSRSDIKPDGKFSLTYNVPYLKTAGQWRLRLVGGDGSPLLEMGVPLPFEPAPISFIRLPRVIAGGQSIRAVISINIGNLSAAHRNLCGQLIDADGRRVDLGKLAIHQTGQHRLWISSEGLKPGRYQLALWLDGADQEKSADHEIDILPTWTGR